MIWKSRMWSICEGRLRDILASVDPRRGTENGNCYGNTFCPRRATKNREERQLLRQHLLSTKGREGPRRTATATATPSVHEGHGGPRRTATAMATPFSTEGSGGPRRTAMATPSVHGGQRRTRRRYGRRGTGEETGAGAVRPGFGGGRCGGAAPAQGRPLAADRPELQ